MKKCVVSVGKAVLVVFLIPLFVVFALYGILRYLLLRVTFRKCRHCAYWKRSFKADWFGYCEHPDVSAHNKDFNGSYQRHSCDWACRFYRPFLWKDVIKGLNERIDDYVQFQDSCLKARGK